MIWLLLHVTAYFVTGYEAIKAAPRIVRARRRRSHAACLARIAKMEIELGLGLDWVLDRLDSFKPALSSRKVEGYSSLTERVFRCYGCEKVVMFEDWDGRKRRDLQDKTLRFCDSCMRSRVHV